MPVTDERPSSWKSLGSDQEIVDQKLVEGRPLLRIHYTRQREFFIARENDIKLSSREALECSTELRPFKDPTYDLLKREHEISIQAVIGTKDNVVQTPWFRKVDNAVQVDPHVIDVRKDFTKSLSEEEQRRVPSINSFLKRVYPRVQHNLVQNAIVPIFVDDYATLEDDDSFIGHKEESFLKELQSFVHHKYTKGKRISSIDWQPKSSKIVAISVVEPIGFGDRLTLNRKVQNSMVIIWSFNDPILPQFVLEAPNEVNVVKFNPNQPHILAAGCRNGQVCLWDISKAQQTMKSKTKKTVRPTTSSANTTASGAAEDRDNREDDAAIIRIKWSQLSKIETGHKRSVNDLCWLPDVLESNFEGKLGHSPDELTHQFATISSDGYMYIWDMRKDNIRKDKLRKTQQEAAKLSGGELAWIPLIKVQLTKVDGTGDIAGLRMHMESGSINPYLLCATTEDGEFVVANWGPQEDKKEQHVQIEYGQSDKEQKTPIKSVSTGHFGPAESLQRHPQKEHLADYYLTVGDWSFKIWRLNTQQPIVVSPCGTAGMTCGKWSPTRPSIVFMGTEDGYLQIWDLLDRSHEPTISQSAAQCAITAFAFKPHEARHRHAANHQQLAVGDDVGVLHIYELPKILIRPHANELQNMERYLEREYKRVNYFTGRWKIRQKELEELHAKQQQDKLEAQLANPVDDRMPLLETEEENIFSDEIIFNDAKQDFLKSLEEDEDL
eukprot:NODE_403_length_2289_cov_30.233580_g374_i0.p1 GENE.NODE_403_length_2289_cov_30.233580_g374_i0~~NODE_403_length_2289_cov_30.233580_g374_i0.p1  ORF type:complete len:744 (-),score=256.09 NODE_403_length_2289_cov_30.233580_g374_i0:56-2224(-)